MKKLLSIMATFSLSVGPAIVFSNVVSCGYKYTEQNIKVDTNKLQILCGDQDYFTIFDFDKLEDVSVSVADSKICSVINDNGTIKVKALDEGETNVIVSAKNSKDNIKVTISTTSLLGSILPKANIVLKLLDSILPAQDEASFAKNITSVVTGGSGIISLIAPLISLLNGLDDSYLTYITNAFDTSKYSDMTNSQVLEAAQIRISNAVLTYLGKYDVTSSTQIDWTDKDQLDKNLATSMADLSSTFTSLIDGSTQINERGVLNDNSIYATSELVASILTIIDYISKANITDDLMSWDDISSFRAKAFNSKDDDGNIDESINLKQLITNFTDIYKSESKAKSLIGILFATTGDAPSKDNPIIKIGLSKANVVYETNGLSSILQSVVIGALSSKTIQKIITDKVAAATAIIGNVPNAVANGIPLIMSYLYNGWDKNEIYISINIIITYNVSIADLYNKLSSSLPADLQPIIESILNDPISALVSNTSGILPPIVDELLNKSLNDVISMISPNTDLGWLFGKLGNAKMSDLINAFTSSVSDDSSISLTGIANIFSGLSNTTYSDNGDSKDLSMSVLKYITSNSSELSDSNSVSWKALGLQTDSIDKNTTLDGLFKITKKNTGLDYLSNLVDKLNSLYENTNNN